MTLICFASQKGSPGTTATALAVAAALKVSNGRRKLLLEADSTGGTLAIRYQLPVEPGLLTLAAAVRGTLDVDGLWRHTQELPGGLPVVVCPDGPEQVHAAMAASGGRLGRFLNDLRDVDVICDVGRLAPDSPSLAFVAEASALLMVARPTAEQLQPAARRLFMLKPRVSNLGWVLVGQKPYGAAEVESTYDFPVVGIIADDARSVAGLERGVMSKRLRRHPFLRSSVTLAATLADWLAPINASPPPSAAGADPSPGLPVEEGGPSRNDTGPVVASSGKPVPPGPADGRPDKPDPVEAVDALDTVDTEYVVDAADAVHAVDAVDGSPASGWPAPPDPVPVPSGDGGPETVAASDPVDLSMLPPPEESGPNGAFPAGPAPESAVGNGAVAGTPHPEPSPPHPNGRYRPPPSFRGEATAPPPSPSPMAEPDLTNPAGGHPDRAPGTEDPALGDPADDPLDAEDWDGSEFTVTADLHQVFGRPGVDQQDDGAANLPAPPRPPAPPSTTPAPPSTTPSPPSTTPSPPSTTPAPPAGPPPPKSWDRGTGPDPGANGTATNGTASPPPPAPPSPFPHEDTDVDWSAS